MPILIAALSTFVVMFLAATKARLTTHIIAPGDKADASSFCMVSRDDIERAARSVLDGSGITLTDRGYDITIIVDVELYYENLEEPVDICAARVSVRSGISTEILLPYANISTQRWVDLFDRADTVVYSRAGFVIEVSDRVTSMMKRFVDTWTNDQ
jgi:hypothetical protein